MRGVGRLLTALSLVGYAALFGYALSGFPHLSTWAEWALNILGACAAVGVFGSWFLAIYHWGTRFPSNDRKKWWGIAVVAGLFIGGWIYWIVGAPGDSELRDGASV